MKRSMWGGVLVLSALSFAGCQNITSTDVTGGASGAPLLPSAATLAADDGMVLMADGSGPQVSTDAASCVDVTTARTLVHLFVNDEVSLALACMRNAAGTQADRASDGAWEWRVHSSLTIDGRLHLFVGTLRARRTDAGFEYELFVSGELRGRLLTHFRLMTGTANSTGTSGFWTVRDVRYDDGRTLVTINWNRQRTDGHDGDAAFTLSHELVSGSTMTTSRSGGTVTYDISLTAGVSGMAAGHYTVSVDVSTHAGSMTSPDGAEHCWDGSGACVACSG